jgi:hypothetical protein
MPFASHQSRHDRIALITIIGYALLITGIQLIDLARFIADDSYFYMTTARNLALTGQQTFSGIMPTNGVHPLWLYLLAGFYLFASQISIPFLYSAYSILPLSVLLLAIIIYTFWKIAEFLELNRLMLTILPISFMGGFSLIGSEAYLLTCCLGILILLSLKAGSRWIDALAIGLAAGAVFLARLDMVFLIAVYYLWLFATKQDIKFFLLAFAITVTIAVSYILTNIWFFGGAVPVSGWLKSSFPNLSIYGIDYMRLGTTLSGYNLLFGVVPILASTVMLFFLRRHLDSKRRLIWVLWGGSVLHLIYTTAFARGATQWLWYYVLPFMLGVFVLAVFIQHKISLQHQARAVTILLLIIAGFFGLYALRTAIRPLSWVDEGALMLEYIEAQNLADAVIIVGDNPGDVSFYSTNQVLGLDMLTTNQTYVRAMLQAENGLQFVLDSAQATGKPVYILLTSGTWLGQIRTSSGNTILSYYFQAPGFHESQYMGSVRLQQPIHVQPNLIVWDASQ